MTNKEEMNHSAARCSLGRRCAEGALFLSAAVLVAASAVVAKESREAPALAAIDPVALTTASPSLPDDPQPLLAAAPERLAPALAPQAAAAPVADAGPVRPTITDPNVRYFDGRPVRPARTVWMTVTAYSPDARSCGEFADGVTASMKSVWTNGMKLVAADTSLLPFGTMLSIPGYDEGRVVPVLDRGGAIKGRRLDVLYPTHEIARQWGVRKLPVTVWEYVDGGAARQ